VAGWSEVTGEPARHRVPLALAVAVLAGVVVADAHPQQADFAASVDAVRVDVDVRRGTTPVTGLRANDFEVLDNGVPQRVELVSPTALPLNVVLALDGSTSLDARERSHLVAAGKGVIDALRPSETAALVTFSDRVAIQSTFTDDWMRLRMLVGGAMPGGDTAVHDAAHVAMVLASSAPGRSMVILFGDGDDTASVLPEDSVFDTAKRTGTVVCVVTLGGEGDVLPRLAELTGGVFVKESSIDRLARRFADILERFRNRYLVSFTPTGVAREGWHTLSVRVKDGGTVRARSGYWAEPAANRR
jgi:Ca-activated chloride channel family protein